MPSERLKLKSSQIFMLKKPFFILLNGPPRCGKSTVANKISQVCRQYNIKHRRDAIAGPMKQFVANLLGQPYSSIKKDERYDILDTTPRRFLIELSEHYLRETYGDDIFSRCFYARNINFPGFVIADDCGMDTELQVVPRDARAVIRILRPGFSFAGDSRNYVENPNYIIRNDVNLNTTLQQVESVLSFIVSEFQQKDLLYIGENK